MDPRSTVAIGERTLGSGHTAVIVPLTGASEDELMRQAQAVAEHPLTERIDLVEWRVDLLDDHAQRSADDLTALATRVRQTAGGIPLLATVRTAAEGGAAEVSDQQYLDLVAALSACAAVDAVDVEHRCSTARQAIQTAQASETTVISSHHDFQRTPSAPQILGHLAEMEATGADVLKIAVMPHTPQDVLTLLESTLTAAERMSRPIITMSMGAQGTPSRLCGGLFGSAATFASIGQVSAPGQLPVETVIAVLDAQQAPQGEDR